MFKLKNLEVTWDIESFKELEWFRKPFNDPDQLQKWRNLGFTHENYNGLLVDSSKPGAVPSWAWDLARNNFDYENISVSLFCMMPGDIIPEHQDTYKKYIEVYKVEDPTSIWRTVVMLEDWHSGHYLEIDGIAQIDWRAGSAFSWNWNTPHLAANIGKTPRYTLQITGTKNLNVQ